MTDLDTWLEFSERRDCKTSRCGGLFRAVLTDEERFVTNASGATSEEAIRKALRLHEQITIENRAQMDADDEAFLKHLAAGERRSA